MNKQPKVSNATTNELAAAISDNLTLKNSQVSNTDVINIHPDDHDMHVGNGASDTEEDILLKTEEPPRAPRPMFMGPAKKARRSRGSRKNQKIGNAAITSNSNGIEPLGKPPTIPPPVTPLTVKANKNLSSKAHGTPKRQRSAHNSPTEPDNNPKRKRTVADVVADSLKMQVTNNPDGIDINQLQLIETKLLDELDKYLDNDPTLVPTYTSSFRNGVLKMFCSDSFSVNWLKETVDSLPPLWDGANISCEPLYGNPLAGNSQRNPSLVQRPPKRPNIRFFVPNGVKQPKFESVTKKLQLQNKPLDTSSWIAWRAEDKGEGIFYHVSVDETDIEFIRTKMGRLFYCFTKIKINLPKVPKGESTEAKDEGEAMKVDQN